MKMMLHGRWMGRISAALVLAMAATAAQSQTSFTHSSASKLTMQGQAEQSNTPAIRDALGRPCLDVEAAARPHTINPEMMDHVVSVKNNCARLIHVKVCYYNADRCNEVNIAANKRADTVLGTMRNVKFFRYSIQQK
ncbi:hypothetical protein IVB16_29455 [Bradyrhizobium sp. 183]|uniref:hypothetical protein n=1 Tax=unclassified Bradyrhizobium TaxID=2631580 RepID=UPI001FFF962E|nr:MULTISPECIES: hypothetical protein [unclassified Bradyrhizobium]UPJ78946.1 hypothetical protein IVB17_29460 [Bradyrhizobium sp. 184]UPJ86739.1 hypothetical protein IVB16_29455 [Bradyrhizobium sp. 183]